MMIPGFAAVADVAAANISLVHKSGSLVRQSSNHLQQNQFRKIFKQQKTSNNLFRMLKSDFPQNQINLLINNSPSHIHTHTHTYTHAHTHTLM